MFLIGPDKAKCMRSISKLASGLDGITVGPTQAVKVARHWLVWSRLKTHENLHTFADGAIIGKLDFSEEPRDTAFVHDEKMPTTIHPLATAVSVLVQNGATIVEPHNATNVFYGGQHVSDMQLLVADVEGFSPSPEGVAALSIVGYFPGNMSLFGEIRKIPFLERYNLDARELMHHPRLQYQKSNDAAMIARLTQIVPNHPRRYLGISAGYDSRFVLGILRRAGIRPHLIHARGPETDLVERLVEQTNLPCSYFTFADGAFLAPGVYTLLTDAQIYFRGGNFSVARSSLEGAGLFYTGHFSYPTLKIAYKGPTTRLGIGRHLLGELVGEHVRHFHGETVPGLREFASMETLKRYLAKELAFWDEYCSFRTAKEWSSWFHYLHTDLRWTPAHMADLSCYAHPVFLLSDLRATLLGISSPAWSNYRKDRARSLNAALLPELSVPYYDGTSYESPKGLQGIWGKLKYWPLGRYANYLVRAGRIVGYVKDRGPSPTPTGPFPETIFARNLVDFRAQDFAQYFTHDFEHIFSGPEYPHSLKRAAVTVGYTLQFLARRPSQ
jgi:hypothetical protein